jgi:hypothetical protein
MKRLALGLLFLVMSTLGFTQGFQIKSFKGDLTLEKDGVLHVTERIDVVFTESHHGIFRDIPVVYDNGKGFTRSIRLSGFSVTDASGQPLPTLVSRKGEDVDIRIGDKDRYEPVGEPLTYIIHYDAFGVINWFDTSTDWEPHCELYWNLTGSEWQETMEKVEFTLHFPEVPGAKDVRARLFPDTYGGRAYQQLVGAFPRAEAKQLGTVMELTQNTLSGGMTRPMWPGRELTLVIDLPASTISKPTFLQELELVALPNLGLAIPLVAVFVLFVFWLKYGKDPAKKPIAVQFEPPDGISGSEAGALIDERVDQRDMAAGIISLAVKGYITITPEDEGMIIKRRTATIMLTNKEGIPLTAFENTLLTKLKHCSQPINEIELRTNVAPYLSQLRGALFDCLIERGYYVANPEAVRNGWLIGGILVIGALGALCYLLSPTHEFVPSLVGGAIGIIVVVFFSRIMPKRTAAGAEAQRNTAGFEEFIRRARGKEFDWMSQKQPTASLFEEYLPHAIAFGLAAEWAAAFEGILHEMPSWYAAPYGTRFYPGYFATDMVSVTNSLSSAASTPPRSDGASGGGSGFGGGGFSGGGFGGGGGGSW